MFSLKPKSIESVLQADLHQTELEYLKNLGAAEYYAALAEMYKQRISRIKGQIEDRTPGTAPESVRSHISERLRSIDHAVLAASGGSVHRLGA